MSQLFEEAANIMAADSPRHFKNPRKPFRSVDAYRELLTVCELILNKAPPIEKVVSSSKTIGLYAGPLGTVYLFFRLSELYPDLKIQGHSCAEIARQYLRISQPSAKSEPDPLHCGTANETLVYLTLEALMADGDKAASSISQVLAYARLICGNNDPEQSSNEWLYGRAGYLYLLRRLRSRLGAVDSEMSGLITETIDRVVGLILAAPQPWTWHGIAFLGSVHGSIGIITQVVLSSPGSAIVLQDQLSALLDLQSDTGNFPSSIPPHFERLVQFCHGAPGFAASLISIRPHFPQLEAKISNALSKARQCTWQSGMLTKTPSLCHGITGNAVVLESSEQMEVFLSHTTGEALRKIEFNEGEKGVDKYLSLYTGEAGNAWAWAVLDKGLEGQVIGYNDT